MVCTIWPAVYVTKLIILHFTRFVLKMEVPLRLKSKVMHVAINQLCYVESRHWSSRKNQRKLVTCQRNAERSILGMTKRDRLRFTVIQREESSTRCAIFCEKAEMVLGRTCGEDDRWSLGNYNNDIGFVWSNTQEKGSRKKRRRDEMYVSVTKWKRVAQNRGEQEKLEYSSGRVAAELLEQLSTVATHYCWERHLHNIGLFQASKTTTSTFVNFYNFTQ